MSIFRPDYLIDDIYALPLDEMAEKGLRCVNVIYNTEKNKYIIVFEKEEVNE